MCLEGHRVQLVTTSGGLHRSASRMLSDNPPAPTRKPSGPISRRDLVANSILQLDIDNELDTFTADIDCLADSSDEEEQQQQLGGKDKNEPQGKADSESAGSSSRREKKGDEQDDDEGDVSFGHSAWCICSA